MQYAVVMDFDQVKKLESGVQKTGNLRKNSLFIVRAGGSDAANEYLDKTEQGYGRKELGNWHPFANSDPDQSQGRVLFAGYSYYFGLSGGNYLANLGRFVWVIAPEAPGAQENAERTIVQPTMEQILAATMKVSERYTPEINREALRQELSSSYKTLFK